ncbi:Protein of uncharacterised function (DUF402) [Mycoplasmopsis maculosa]|uniref:Protein of uncharacterized function (DUF402) n=1 Tax=Mycoplasmopsis maculosa TaxID=114885 RepID=A0A449B4P0_9BACT|nr:DUF402 domain-containing protein [Mycoplasmopsis maculosa]VEU75574.1 Protein of uncharacterised function (DUF402) [Mycoplasmopsis maculosa]
MIKKSNKNIFPLEGSIINVQAYKYNGDLYRQWNGCKVLRNTSKHYVLLLYKTKVSEKWEHNWVYRDYVIWFMPKTGMHNALILLKPKQNYIYVNIASNPLYEDNTIKFIDFDIDLKHYPHNNISIVDEEEFNENKINYKYPKKITTMVFNSVKKVLEKYEKSEYFFNPEVIDYYIDLAKKDKSLPAQFRKDLKIKIRKHKVK